MNRIELAGCSPRPVASYLKALGIFRIVAEQADPDARAHWEGDRFVLMSALSREELRTFLLESYAPSPLVAPWNGGSGFRTSDKRQRAVVEGIRDGSAERFATYRATIRAAEAVRDRLGLGLEHKVDTKDKPTLLELCRARLPDDAVRWLDAAFVLTADGPSYPPLLGTGGNDGRLEFTNNFMQRVCELFDPTTGAAYAAAPTTLDDALFAAFAAGRTDAAIGQFHPGAAGGANASTGFDANAAINRWDFVFALEGALTFAAASTRRLGAKTPGALAYPFSVRQSGIGYGSAAESDEAESRAEIWLPLWSRPSSIRELFALFSEGRAQIGGRPARNGVDFARAIADLGVDRGIASFERYGFQVRNGLSYFATPLGRFEVTLKPEVQELLGPLDAWLDTFRRRAGEDRAPASAQRARRNLEDAIIAMTQDARPNTIARTFIALGQCERVLVRSERWREESRINPPPHLDVAWIRRCPESTELRLACALASVYANTRGLAPDAARKVRVSPGSLRMQLEPAATNAERVWWDETRKPGVVWNERSLVDGLLAVSGRRMIAYQQAGLRTYADGASVRCRLADVQTFIDGRTNDALLRDYLYAAILVGWRSTTLAWATPRSASSEQADAMYVLIKGCFPGASAHKDDDPVLLDPTIFKLAANGDARRASERAVRRLRADGRSPRVSHVSHTRAISRRCAAAIAFPVESRAFARVLNHVAPTSVATSDSHPNENDDLHLDASGALQ